MKANYENIASKKGNESFLAYSVAVPAFEFKWHYHPEYELTLITKGKGKRLVGDSNESFTTGDLVLLGPGLPHTWSSDVVKKKIVSAVVIQFPEEFIGNFLHLNGFEKIGKLLSTSSHGLFFPDANELIPQIEMLPESTGVEKVTSLLSILQQLTSQKVVKLSSEYFNAVKSEETEKRINKVCQYIQKNSTRILDLESIASLIHLSPSAFCKFFKRATGKTYSDYVNDIRIGNACHSLIESDKAISEVAFETGFESLTYFNRVFLKKKGITPKQYRNKVLV
ncbi:MAG TPA: AraC family transcriptional regulator [Chryseolinea sp.]|nr:AraC family transcriptional regulator [Chryseolinea sp.]HPM29096.1 AraC family transcriptional regulator [Chryseolinea sp.]